MTELSTTRERRIAINEARFRDINERLESGLRQVPQAPELLEFVCECGDRSCEQHVRLTFDEYEAVRRDSRHFAVVPGHAAPDTERVILSAERYEVVEKFGSAVEITDAHRARRRGETTTQAPVARPSEFGGGPPARALLPSGRA